MSNEAYYGKDCPAGMVQVQFVWCAPNDRYGDYGWKPCKSAFLEIFVDGVRFRIDIGNLREHGLSGRGIHINGPIDMVYERTAINACCIAIPSSVDAPKKAVEGGEKQHTTRASVN